MSTDTVTQKPRLKSNYYYLGDELRETFGQKVYKISLDSGFTCPTRDGSKGTKGCFYCGQTGSHYSNAVYTRTVATQIEEGKSFMRNRHGADKFIAYFQSYTSTYGDVSLLKAKLGEALEDPDIVGLNLSTRPDCLDDERLAILAEHMLDKYHWLELGLESGHDSVLKRCGRGHGYAEFETTFKQAKARGFRICVHLILGLPGETDEMAIDTMKRLADLGIDGIKLHNLHIIKNSVFELEYKLNRIPLMSLPEYCDLVGRILPQIPENVVIHRLTGEAPPNLMLAPDWSFNKAKAMNALDTFIIEKQIVQGSNFRP
ncbi:MAG: TIGR01212 family radical SAM protein [Candidatus Margulisiibacteriota bacterium]